MCNDSVRFAIDGYTHLHDFNDKNYDASNFLEQSLFEK